MAEVEKDPLRHFFHVGFKEGRWPNPYFDPLWYLAEHPDVRESAFHPLVHYARHGDLEGRRPSPLFDTAWYRSHYRLSQQEGALAHFLERRRSGEFSPLPDFDAKYYMLHNPDVVAAGVDPFEHFLYSGIREGRNPSADFDAKFYSARYLREDPGQNPFLHYLAHKQEPGVVGKMPVSEASIPREVKRFSKPGPEFEEFHGLPISASPRAKLLAYYLPQFHAIPENDAWWGKGFTEWTNIARGLPRFHGHYQPRIPRDLGFYSLETNEPFRKQAALARAAGLYGFVFYYYRFNGRRLLEGPIERFLADPSINFNFALMWANENWTRRWDGADSQILISQDYLQSDDESLMEDFVRHFRDPRYIRLAGRPLLMIYRPGLIPKAREVLGRWRQLLNERFNENPIIVMAQVFGDLNPKVYELDGAIEFPPHKLTQGMKGVQDGLELLDPEFDGVVLEYDRVISTSLDDDAPQFPLIKTLFPSWDNCARRLEGGTVISGSTPQKYEFWLSRLIRYAQRNPFFGERIVCINAWNEWAEGAYLEPDQYYGSAYLNATGRAVAGIERLGDVPRLLLVGHDAHPHGAQELLLNIGQTLRYSFGLGVEFLLLEGGELEPRYAKIGRVTILNNDGDPKALFTSLGSRGFDHAIVNTTAAARIVPLAMDAGIGCIVLVHELPRIIGEMKLESGLRAALKFADKVVFASTFVRDELLRAFNFPVSDKLIICPQGVYKPIKFSEKEGANVRRDLQIEDSEALVIGMGYGDLRKGFDLFIQLWRMFCHDETRVHFCWVGKLDPLLEEWLRGEISDAALTGTFHAVGYSDDVAAYFSAADAFVLTSREDPFPSVVLEALSVGLPVVAFERSGGIPELLRRHAAGRVVPYADVIAMGTELRTILRSTRIEKEDRVVRRALTDAHYGWKAYVRELLRLSMPAMPRISVGVVNYNYAQYMPERLASVFGQTHPVHEIFVLDDCSGDSSLEVIETVAKDWNRDITLVKNDVNSGSAFAQWQKAAEVSSGEYVWIAEADDLSRPEFLTKLVTLLVADPKVRFVFSDSQTIDQAGSPTSGSYKSYYTTVEPDALMRTTVFDGSEFALRFLSVKNLILNVSAVLWRRDALSRALRACGNELRSYRVAGDWRLYLQALSESDARVGYESEPLNLHRRHSGSVTHSLSAQRHIREICEIHKYGLTRFDWTKETADLQRRYVAEISAQFGVPPVNEGSNSVPSKAPERVGKRTRS